jgi:hypothetical protein
VLALLERYSFVTGVNLLINRFMDGRKEQGVVSFGNKKPRRNKMSFSQEAGPFIGAMFIGFILTAKGCCIDREAATLSCPFFLSDIRDRG